MIKVKFKNLNLIYFYHMKQIFASFRVTLYTKYPDSFLDYFHKNN